MKISFRTEILNKDNLCRTSTSNNTTSSIFIQPGTSRFIQVTIALFSAGLATFALLYCVQPILPILSQEFNISPAVSSISLSISTGLMALGLLITGPISDAVGRKSVMVVGLLLAALCTIISASITSWYSILFMRSLIGLSLSGVAAVGMTYLTEEIHPKMISFSMGLYISGNSIGGMTGRLLSGLLTNYFNWRISFIIVGFFALIAALIFWKILPTSQNFHPTTLSLNNWIKGVKLHCSDQGLPLLFIEGFLLMGSFVTLFNYIGYRLLGYPWYLSHEIVNFISIIYLVGLWSSLRVGILTNRFSQGLIIFSSTLIMLISLIFIYFNSIWLILIGIALFTASFFAAHSVASCWIGQRANYAKAQASSLYLCSYYMGSSIAGTVGGVFWYNYKWTGITIFISLLLIISLIISLKLIYRKL